MQSTTTNRFLYHKWLAQGESSLSEKVLPLTTWPYSHKDTLTVVKQDQKPAFLRPPGPLDEEETSEADVDVSESAITNVTPQTPPAPAKQCPWEAWPPIRTYDEFEISPDEVKKRAAWGWYRTGVICAQAALAGVKDTEDNPGLTGPSENALLAKSERAKSHALLLYPDLLEQEDIGCPSWAEQFTARDEEYYLEMERNQEYIMRAEMAEVYKDSARAYIMEPLYLYLEWKQEQEIEATKAEPREIHEYLAAEIQADKFGCLSRLWDRAIDLSGLRRPLNDWWLRAAHARGHAEWLLRERRDSTTVGHPSPIESWRLLPPGTVGHYDNSCVVWSIHTAVLWGGFEDDLFFTYFNSLSEDMRGRASREAGWPLYSYVYGAPEFVFHALAKDAADCSLIGLVPADTASRQYGQAATSISVYDRYMRRGIHSLLDESYPEHHRILAQCADNILAEWDAENALYALLHPRYKKSRNLDLLKSALRPLLEKRAYMTFREAEDTQFDDTVYACIRFHMDKIQRMLRRPPGIDEHRYLIWVEREVSKLLAPWFDFHLKETRGGRILIHLVSLLSRRTILDPHPPEFASIAEPVWACYQGSVVAALDSFLEDVREMLQGNVWLTPHTYLFILPFKEYLESGGDPNKMPLIRGTIGGRRELTKLGLYKSGRIKCKPGCKCPLPMRIEEMEKQLRLRLSEDPQARREREAIIRFFMLNSSSSVGSNGKFAGITPQRLELFSRVRKQD
ncbi:hypothetical protein DL765_002784 [Monosporascus sp. GIB2]|nr:hypothetical protein DL765_002784 [Monosporascus sp. GIB2]